MRTVIVTGATGQIGVFLLPRLLAADCRVVALSRRIQRGTGFNPQAGGGRLSWVHPEDWRGPGASGGDDERGNWLISAGPIELAAGLLERRTAWGGVVCFSSSSVLVKGGSPVPTERAQVRAMIAAERALRRDCRSRSIPLWLFRPTLIYGCGLDENISRVAWFGQRFRFVPIAGAAHGLRQPVHADDVAQLAVSALSDEASDGLESPVVGGETLTYAEMVERVLSGLGLRPRLLRLPPALMTVAAAVAGHVWRRSGLNAEMARRQNRDLKFDDTAVRTRLGYAPRPFRPTARDFTTPAEAKALQP